MCRQLHGEGHTGKFSKSSFVTRMKSERQTGTNVRPWGNLSWPEQSKAVTQGYQVTSVTVLQSKKP